MRVQDQPAYILHHRAFRDTSQILEVITPDYGRLSLMSRGSRGAKSRLKSILQPFRPLIVSWSGKGEMPTLTGAEPQTVKTITLTGKALPSAFYVNELIIKLLHKHDVHESVYRLYESVIRLLADKHEIEPILRLFEKQLLEELGFGLNLSVNAETGEAVLSDDEYAYYLEHGPVAISSVHDESYILKLSGKSLIDLDENTLDNIQSLKDAKRLMRVVLNYYLEGKPIKSRELFR
ncbi:MAG: DNA repair protein RecO [endosymbiont of Galathealinum brachiosum]|uniref:DNA repair protein RecO n=1 Tax=endosymbiont of Galathealinum brachiosum TaxID=2200906 RepID=A0A370DIH6_9GAMM|nr:MAG: DNA repair protein RecO [endosymbiont of Galathealinum brachiosum]